MSGCFVPARRLRLRFVPGKPDMKLDCAQKATRAATLSFAGSMIAWLEQFRRQQPNRSTLTGMSSKKITNRIPYNLRPFSAAAAGFDRDWKLVWLNSPPSFPTLAAANPIEWLPANVNPPARPRPHCRRGSFFSSA